MPIRYKYRATSEQGLIQKGVVNADTAEQALDYLVQQRLTPIIVSRMNQTSGFSIWGFFRGRLYEDLIMFTANLNTLYGAGIPLLQSLSKIRIGPAGSRFNDAISQIRLSLQSGKSLSRAMGEFDDIFPKFYVASVAAGEESGKLEEILEQLASMLEKELELTRQIKSGVRYPLFVVVAIAVAFVVVMTYVVPKFIEFYGSFNAELPVFTRGLIALSDILRQYWVAILAAVVGGGIAFIRLTMNARAKLVIDRHLLKVPILGKLIIKGNVARFSMMFAILMRSGLPIIKSLDILKESVKNNAIGLEVHKIEQLFREGRDSRLVAGGFKYFPDMALQMMAVGLESGKLENMLDQVGLHYAKEVQYVSRHLTAILEPVLTVVLGVFVLILALSIFLPMWNLIQVFTGR